MQFEKFILDDNFSQWNSHYQNIICDLSNISDPSGSTIKETVSNRINWIPYGIDHLAQASKQNPHPHPAPCRCSVIHKYDNGGNRYKMEIMFLQGFVAHLWCSLGNAFLL